MKFIKDTYNLNKIWFHSQPENRGMQLHHIFSRRGVWLCCKLGFIGLTQREHESWKVLKMLREENNGLKLSVEKNYLHGIGCSVAVDEKCKTCNLLRDDY